MASESPGPPSLPGTLTLRGAPLSPSSLSCGWMGLTAVSGGSAAAQPGSSACPEARPLPPLSSGGGTHRALYPPAELNGSPPRAGWAFLRSDKSPGQEEKPKAKLRVHTQCLKSPGLLNPAESLSPGSTGGQRQALRGVGTRSAQGLPQSTLWGGAAGETLGALDRDQPQGPRTGPGQGTGRV